MINQMANRVALATVTLAAAILAVPTAATASESELVVSTDGTHYTTAEVLPVFPGDMRLVPGDSESASFWIRNDSEHTGLLRLDLIDPMSVDALFATHLALSAAPDGAGSRPITMETAIANGSCTVLSGDRVLAPGQAARVQVTAALSPELIDAQGALSDLRFRLRAVLADASAATAQSAGTACAAAPEQGGATPQPSPTSSPGALAVTGGTLPLTVAAVGAAAIIAGLFAFLWGRRRRSEGDAADV